MTRRPAFPLLLVLVGACRAQPSPACEWCGLAEAPARLTATARLPPADGVPMRLHGVVRDAAGRPVAGVRLYAYHTDAAGRYTPSATPRGNERRHGRLRGWLLTDAAGRYRIETVRPGPYPGRPDPQHVHLATARPGDAERYAGEVVFSDDPRVTPAWRAAQRRDRDPAIDPLVVCTPTRAADGAWDVPCDLLAPGPAARAAPDGRRYGARAPRVQGRWAAAGLAFAGGAEAAPAPRGAAPVKEVFTVDVAATAIRWEGFSLRGSHEGTLRAASGFLRYGPDGQLVAGEVVVPLASLAVTDVEEPGPRRRLRDHLLAEDFFWADRFPTARLVVTGAARPAAGRLRVAATLTMRGVTLPVAFDAAERVRPDGRVEVRARLDLDRQRWGVRFTRSRDLFVRDRFTLDVVLVATPQV